MILAEYTDYLTMESTDGGDSFTFLAGYESINILEVSVPEPGTVPLIAVGLLVGLSPRASRPR